MPSSGTLAFCVIAIDIVRRDVLARTRLSQSHEFRHRMILRIRTIICGRHQRI
jgi:hypothetical protein